MHWRESWQNVGARQHLLVLFLRRCPTSEWIRSCNTSVRPALSRVTGSHFVNKRISTLSRAHEILIVLTVGSSTPVREENRILAQTSDAVHNTDVDNVNRLVVTSRINQGVEWTVEVLIEDYILHLRPLSAIAMVRDGSTT